MERPGGGDFARSYDDVVKDLSSHFVWINRSKESLALDLKREAAREVLNHLLERADVFVQNLAPGATGRLGFGTEPCASATPGSSCATSPATVPQVLTETRKPTICSSSARPASCPSQAHQRPAGIAVADIAAGMYAYSSILAALFRRERTGEGAAIERLEKAGIANARLRSVREFLDHPQLKARDRWREVGSPAGQIQALLPPATVSGAEAVMAPIPEVGEHTASILSELGYDKEALKG